jgi:hypothetical protein
LKLECIQQTSAPQPHLDLPDAEWVADLKMTGTNWLVVLSSIKKDKKSFEIGDDGPEPLIF